MATVREAANATLEDLYRTPEKAEIVNGVLVLMPPTGIEPGYAADEIFASLHEHACRTGRGRAVANNKGFVVDLPHRRSFSPDAAYCVDDQRGMRFYQGAPAFAVEVRSEGDYGATSETEQAAKRRDYFAAGTLVVWDVDLLSDDIIRVYRAANPNVATVYRRGQQAEAEPAVSGWSMRVDDLFV